TLESVVEFQWALLRATLAVCVRLAAVRPGSRWRPPAYIARRAGARPTRLARVYEATPVRATLAAPQREALRLDPREPGQQPADQQAAQQQRRLRPSHAAPDEGVQQGQRQQAAREGYREHARAARLGPGVVVQRAEYEAD